MTLFEKRYATAINLVTNNNVQYAVGILFYLSLAFIVVGFAYEPTSELAISTAYLVLANSAIAVSLLLFMLRHGEASRVSALLFSAPPTAELIAWGILGEVLPPIAWLGIAMAASGVSLIPRTA